MPSFKVPCPSCENQVLIKDPKLIGTKVECPKCKYRFKLEEPAGGVPADDGKANEKANKPKKAPEGGDASAKKKKKKLVAIVIGVLAVGVLAAVGFALMGGKETKPSSTPFVPNPNIAKGTTPGGPTTPGGSTPPVDPKAEKKKDVPAEIPKVVVPPSEKDPTNLLPGQTVTLYRFDLEKLRNTPLQQTISDPVLTSMFKDSFGIDAKDVSLYYHAFVGESRDPFGIIRIKEPISESEVLSRMTLADSSRKIKGRTLHTFKRNPFINAIANTLSLGSLFADLYTAVPTPQVKPPESRIFGVCVYDVQHVLIGDVQLLEKYLDQLENKGYPKFQSLTNPPAGSNIPFAKNPLYLSIDPNLKNLLLSLGSEENSPPPVLFADKVVQGLYDPKLFKNDFQPLSAILDPILNRTLYLGAKLVSFRTDQLNAEVKLVMVSEAETLEVVRNQFIPGLSFATGVMSHFLDSPVNFINQTPIGGGVPPGPGGGTPTQPGPGPGVLPGPGPGRPVGGPGMPGRPGAGQAAEGRPGQPPPQPGFQPPGMPGVPQPGGLDPSGQSGPKKGPISTITLGLVDRIITVKISIHWTDEVYSRLLAPHMYNYASTIKGKMGIYSSELSYQGLATAVPKMTGTIKQFPKGTFDREITDSTRRNLKYPPETRVSFYAELLPFMGRDVLANGIHRELAWFDERNLTAAEAWIPELLVPAYPQSAWRAGSPFVPDGRVMGATNYVAIAGVGDDAARYNPGNPAEAKKVGLVGYDWGSKVEEVTDGLSNTIYMMQTPPGLSQPWIAGGGATVRGLNERDPMLGFRHNFTPDGQPGTYALMGDGSTRFIRGNISPEVLKAMATRAGGENLADLDKEAPRVDQPKKVEMKAEAKPATPKPIETPAPKPADPKKESPPKDPAPAAKLEVAPAPRVKM